MLALLLLAVVVRPEGAVVRVSCDSGAEQVGSLAGGTQLTIRFAMAGDTGTCYKIEAGGVEGYLPASALQGLEQFDKARRSGRSVGGFRAETTESKQLRERILLPLSGPLAKAVQLIEGGEFSEALAETERYLKVDPKNVGALTIAGYAAYQSDDLKSAVDYWEQAGDIQPDANVEAMLARAKRELSADKSSQKAYSSRFLLRYEESIPDALARQMTALLESEFARISGELGCSAAERIVTIVQTPEAYRRTTDAAEWSGGQYSGRIHVALIEGTNLGERTRRVLSHELVHACLANLGRWPAWLNEGLAQKLSGERTSAEMRAAIRTLARDGKLPKLSELGDRWGGLGAGSAALAYAMALVAVENFYEHHAGLGIRNLLRDSSHLERVTPDLDRRLRE